ncbi:MAG: DUF421 domain-containing protein [Bacillota bacterium]|nr:DUF421 domain-containing protein [Bacillota bacterium]
MEPFVEALFKTTVAFFGILVYARILGKEQMSQLTFYDYVTGITFGNIAAMIAVEPRKDIYLLLWVLTVFAALNYVMGVVTEKNRPLRKIIEGEPTIIIHNGKILEHNMAKNRYNMENLMMQLREKDVFDVADVEFAIAETDGILTVQKKSIRRPVTPDDMGMQPAYEGVPSELIVDGDIIYQNLEQNHLDEAWLMKKLREKGYESVQQIDYLSVDTYGNVYIDPVDDKLKDPVNITD